jgi:hypothetical protein
MAVRREIFNELFQDFLDPWAPKVGQLLPARHRRT